MRWNLQDWGAQHATKEGDDSGIVLANSLENKSVQKGEEKILFSLALATVPIHSTVAVVDADGREGEDLEVVALCGMGGAVKADDVGIVIFLLHGRPLLF
jgi:hypothetical protein